MNGSKISKGFALMAAAALVGCDSATGPETFTPPPPLATALGAIQIVVETRGLDLDRDGYTASLDGLERGRIGANGQTVLARVGAGGHLVELTDLASNCAVVGENPRAVLVREAQTAEVVFTVDCSLVPL